MRLFHTTTLLLASASISRGFTIAVAGAHGRLGRELVHQSVKRKWETCALSRRSAEPLFEPCRRGLLNEETLVRKPMRSDFLKVVEYGDEGEYDAVVFAVSGSPFSEDTSDQVIRDVCARLPKRCQKVCLVSAFGVGDSLLRSNIGIRAMEGWYLKDVYASKRSAERIVSLLPSSVTVLILRPRALTHAHIPIIGMSRKVLTHSILEWIVS
jgi:hypothetical protein